MNKVFAGLACVFALVGGVYFAASKWAVRHETLNFFDAARQRPVAVDLAVRRDYEMQANEGYWKLPVAVISKGNTVENTEYSFLANVLAARGYLVASVQQDLPTDPNVHVERLALSAFFDNPAAERYLCVLSAGCASNGL